MMLCSVVCCNHFTCFHVEGGSDSKKGVRSIWSANIISECTSTARKAYGREVDKNLPSMQKAK